MLFMQNIAAAVVLATGACNDLDNPTILRYLTKKQFDQNSTFLVKIPKD